MVREDGRQILRAILASYLPDFCRLSSTNHDWFLNFTPEDLRTYLYLHTYDARVCMYLRMLMYVHIYICAHTYIKTPEVLSLGVHTTYWTSPCPSLPICAPQHFTGSAPRSAFRHPIFSLSSDSQSLAIPPGGCSAEKFVLS